MNDYQSPFEILGIENNADKKQIRIAYARLLKTVRPDEDPEAFQKLREARDNALWDMQFQSMDFEQEDIDPNDPPPEQEPVVQLPAVETDETASPPHNEPQADRFAPAPLAQEQDPEVVDPDAPDQEELKERIEQLFGPWNTPWDLGRWQPILSDLGKLDMWTRKDFEFSIVAKLGDQSLGDSQPSSTRTKHDTRKQVMTLLNEEFGWLDNDAMIYDTLPDNKADRFIRVLRNSVLQATEKQSFNRSIPLGTNTQNRTVPLIETEDLNSFFGDPDTKERTNFKFYRESASNDDWALSWNWWGFLFSYGWTAWRGLWIHTLALVAASYTGWFMLLGAPKGGAVAILGLILVVMTHSLPAWRGRRWLVQSAADAASAADEKGLLNGLERAAFIADKGRRGDWYLVILVVVIGWGARELPKQIFPKIGAQIPAVSLEKIKKVCTTGDVECIAKICRSDVNFLRCAVNHCAKQDAKCIMAVLDINIERLKNKLDPARKTCAKGDQDCLLKACPKGDRKCIGDAIRQDSKRKANELMS